MKSRLFGTIVAAATALAGCNQPDDDSGGHGDAARDDGRTDFGGADADADADTDGRSDYVPSDGTGDGACYQDLDIVFVIDVSTSMTPILTALRDGIGDVWSYAMGISANTRFGLVVFVDDVKFANDGVPFGDAATMQAEFDRWRSFTSSEAEPGGGAGTNIDCPENTIDAVWVAAHGFPWRENSIRVIILATDDTFKENPQTLGSGPIRVMHTYSDLLDSLRASQIRVAAFADHTNQDCALGSGTSTEPGFYTDWSGSPPLPAGTGAEVFDIQQVRGGTLSMTEAINGVILDEYCTPYIY